MVPALHPLRQECLGEITTIDEIFKNLLYSLTSSSQTIGIIIISIDSMPKLWNSLSQGQGPWGSDRAIKFYINSWKAFILWKYFPLPLDIKQTNYKKYTNTYTTTYKVVMRKGILSKVLKFVTQRSGVPVLRWGYINCTV